MTLNAQSPKEEYDIAVDYCACKISYAYTNQYISNGKAENYNQNEFNREKKSFESVIKQKLENCNIEEHITYDKLKVLLSNNNFSGFAGKLESAVKESKKVNLDGINKQQAINNILNGFYNNDDFSKIVLKYSAVKELKSSLESELNKTLNSLKEQTSFEDNETINTAESITTNEINHSNSIINKEDTNQLKSTFFPNWLLFALILLAFIILFIYNYISNKKLNERIDRRLSKSEYEQSKIQFNPSNNRNKSNNSRPERDIKDIYDKISKLNLDIERLQNSNTNSSVSGMQKTSQVKSISQPKPKETQKFAFAKTPVSDKVFNAFDVNDDKDGKFYKFTLKENNQAEFQFFNTENSAKRALNAPDSFLYPACEETEPLNQNAKKIITIKPGIAIKQDDKWIVKEKAQITYE
ncbi:hypothetical protein LPB303_06380 [Polaribacter atrinae]|uniref:Uncharacterized protein n=1 Tax=Polaribacter atrinae TaxID=1333662 RepID=A0A176TDG7_9FLAO|nr:hypothetical protein LPB303_06380 [Polaribacter atrinae]